MYKHPLVYFLAKRIDRLLLIPFCLTALLFLLSVFHHTYPGHSALLVADAARLTPTLQQTHGLFSTLVHLLAQCPVLTLPFRLNLFSVLCGCLSATLFFRLLARTLLIYAYDPHEDEVHVWTEEEMEEKPVFNSIIKNVGKYNQRLLSIAIQSSLVAALLLAVMAPFWLATTHLNEAIFNLFLMLVILTLFPYEETPLSHARFLLATFLFTLGVFESTVFLLLLPVLASMTFRFYLQMESKSLVLLHTLFGGCLGVMIAFSLRPPSPSDPSFTFLFNLGRFLKTIADHHVDELQMLFVSKGWLWSFFQTAIPAAFLLFGKNLILEKWSNNTRLASMIFLALAIPGALNLSISPFAQAQEFDHLPVFSSVLLAATLALVLTASRLFFVPKSGATIDEKEVLVLEEEVPPPPSQKPAGIFIGLVVSLALITPFRSLPYIQANNSQFADAVAHKLVTHMGERTWLVTNGQLDNHLRIQADLLKKPLVLVTLRQEDNQKEQQAIMKRIEIDPTFQTLNRPRLLNALSIGTIRFMMEWLSADTNASKHVMIFGMPDLLTACHLRALPQGLVFSGSSASGPIEPQPLIDVSKDMAQKLAPLLLENGAKACPIPAKLSALLRLRMGYNANELGALLEDLGLSAEAFAAYQRATEIDSDNVSALLNAYALAKGGHAKSSQATAMRQRLRQLLQDRAISRLGLQGLFLNYGTIHQKAFYQQEAKIWLALGSPAIASGKMKRKLDLSQKTGAQTLIERAHYYCISGKPEQAEACYLAVLEQNPTDFDAIYGMTILMINTRDIPKAELWLARATETKNETAINLLYPTILIALQKGDMTHADKLLVDATQKYPHDERFWKIRAVSLLQQGEVLLVRHQILPEMTKALKDPDHYLIHIVRGLLLKQQGKANYREARISLLKGLSRNASLPELWNSVLELDMLIGNLGLMERDINHLLLLDPDHAQANYMKGSIQLARKKLSSAEDFMRRSIEKMPTAAACNDLAEILRRQKKLEEAKTFAHQAIALDSKLPNARETLAAILADAEKEEASPPPAKRE